MHTPAPGNLLEVRQTGPQGVSLVTSLPPMQALNLLNTLAEQLRVQIAVQAVTDAQRVKVAGPEEMPPLSPGAQS